VKVYFYQLDGKKKNLLDDLLNPLSDEAELELAEKYSDIADRYKIGWCYITEKYKHQYSSGQWRWMFPGLDSMVNSYLETFSMGMKNGQQVLA
jgi:hypothetical protein